MSFTGSEAAVRAVGKTVQARFGKSSSSSAATMVRPPSPLEQDFAAPREVRHQVRKLRNGTKKKTAACVASGDDGNKKCMVVFGGGAPKNDGDVGSAWMQLGARKRVSRRSHPGGRTGPKERMWSTQCCSVNARGAVYQISNDACRTRERYRGVGERAHVGRSPQRVERGKVLLCLLEQGLCEPKPLFLPSSPNEMTADVKLLEEILQHFLRCFWLQIDFILSTLDWNPENDLRHFETRSSV